MAKTKVSGIKEARKKLKDVQDNALKERIIVTAAKKNARGLLSDMQSNMSRAVERGSELNDLIGLRKIPRKLAGKEAPGAFVGLKDKKKFTKPENTEEGGAEYVLNVYWIEYGTSERTQNRTGRSTGKLTAKSPMRDAIRSNRDNTAAGFQNEIIKAVNRRISRNKL